MKIEQDNEYRPITITLETREEAKLFNELILHCNKNIDSYLIDFGKKLWNLLYANADF